MDVREIYEKLNNLEPDDLKKIGTAPKAVQYGAIAVLCIAVLAGMGWFMVKPQLDALDRAERQEQELRQQFESMQRRAANLQAYRDQLAEMQESFGALLRQLPDEVDIESLLVDLSQTSVAAGLEVEFFRPRAEQRREFYSEYPIELRVTGHYHQFGSFVSGLAALPRIVTLHDISIAPAGRGGAQPGDSPMLTMTLTARTYRYLDEDEMNEGGS